MQGYIVLFCTIFVSCNMRYLGFAHICMPSTLRLYRHTCPLSPRYVALAICSPNMWSYIRLHGFWVLLPYFVAHKFHPWEYVRIPSGIKSDDQKNICRYSCCAILYMVIWLPKPLSACNNIPLIWFITDLDIHVAFYSIILFTSA